MIQDHYKVIVLLLLVSLLPWIVNANLDYFFFNRQHSHYNDVLLLEVRAAPIFDVDRHITHAIVVFQDITARKQIEEDYAKVRNDFN